MPYKSLDEKRAHDREYQRRKRGLSSPSESTQKVDNRPERVEHERADNRADEGTKISQMPDAATHFGDEYIEKSTEPENNPKENPDKFKRYDEIKETLREINPFAGGKWRSEPEPNPTDRRDRVNATRPVESRADTEGQNSGYSWLIWVILFVVGGFFAWRFLSGRGKQQPQIIEPSSPTPTEAPPSLSGLDALLSLGKVE